MAEINKEDTVKVKKQVELFLTETFEARQASERDRDYYDHKQWTEDQIATLKMRHQAPVVVNRVKPKVDGIVGLYVLRNNDPKAYPRSTKDHKAEQTAHAVTDALRYVVDNNDFVQTKKEVAEDVVVEGYGGAIVDVKQNNREIEIIITRVPWDRIYFDPHSRRIDFSDARFMGQIIWLGVDEAKELFEGVDIDALVAGTDEDDDTFEDRPRWVDKKTNRVRIAQHFFKEDGKWKMAIFSGNTFLVDPMDSPYADEFGEPGNPIELCSAYIDRNNRRYGEVRSFIDQQNEINHRRSKALHMLSTRQTVSRKGAIRDIEEMKRELAKPNGHVEYTGEKGDFEVLNTNDMAMGQIELYRDSKAELDAVSLNAQLSGERQEGSLSGRAIEKLQAAGTLELNGLLSNLNGWEKRIYRQIWSRVKQFWNEEKWIRVTDDYDNLRWVGLNNKVTAREWLEEQINDESLPRFQRKQAAASYTFLLQAEQSDDPEVALAAQQKLEEVVSVSNEVSELDVDIILDQSFDTVNVRQEQFQMLAQFASGGDVDILDLLELSEFRNKDELIEKIEQRRQASAEAQGNVAQMQSQELMAKTAKTLSETKINEQKAIQTNIENMLLVRNPDNNPQSIV